MKAAVQMLLSLAEEGDQVSGVKSRALRRLYWLSGNGFLTKTEGRAFGKALWSKINSRDEVPSIRGLNRHFCLWCPEPTPGKAARHLKAFFLKTPIPYFRTGFELGDSRLTALWAGTAEYSGQQTKSGCARLDWNADEVSQILSSILNWWNDEGRTKTKTSGHWIHDDAINDRLTNVLRILMRVVIPRIKPNGPLTSQVIQLVEEIEASDFPTELVLPALLRFAPERENDFVERLCRALLSNDAKRIESSLNGIFFWMDEYVARRKKRSYYRFPHPPARLLDELAILASHRRQPGLLLVLSAIRWAITSFPTMLSSEFVKHTTTALDCLLCETRFDSPLSDTPFTQEELPSYRLYAARVAVLMHNHPHARSSVTEQWLIEIRDDVLPEVRKCLDPETQSEDE